MKADRKPQFEVTLSETALSERISSRIVSQPPVVCVEKKTFSVAETTATLPLHMVLTSSAKHRLYKTFSFFLPMCLSRALFYR
jgi:hypothetical protein